MRTFLFTIATALLVCVGCKSPVENPAPCSTSAYLPLAVGDWWQYAAYHIDSAGVKIAGTDLIETDSITGIDTTGGRTGYFMARSYARPVHLAFSSQCDPQMLDTCDCEKWWMYAMFSASAVGLAGTDQAQSAPIPIVDSTGNIVAVTRRLSLREFYRGMESVAVPLGTFDSRHYCDSLLTTMSNGFEYLSGSPDVVVTDRYFAAGVGLFREVTWSTNRHYGFVGGTVRTLRALALH